MDRGKKEKSEKAIWSSDFRWLICMPTWASEG